MELSIIIGILTGLVANGMTTFFREVFMPAYRNYVYIGLSLTGDWIIEQDDGPTDGKGFAKKWVMSATLTQKANKLIGATTATNIENGISVSVINYVIEGYFYDGVINLSCLRKDNDVIAHSNFLLQVVEDGKTLAGYRSFYGLKSCSIRSVKTVWKKSGHNSIKNSGKNLVNEAKTPNLLETNKENDSIAIIKSN
jgi:hypothetical protein